MAGFGFAGNPNALLSAIQGMSPSTSRSWANSTSAQYQPWGGGSGTSWDQAVSGGGGGGGSRGYGTMQTGGSESNSGSYSVDNNAKIGAFASALPQAYRQQNMGRIMPQMQGVYSSLGGIGGQSTPAPQITQAPIWNPGQIQGQVNLMRGQNNAQAQSGNKQLSQQMAGRGMGSSSPLLAALQNSSNLGSLQTNTAGENNLRWNAAQGNAQQVFQEQVAQGNLWNQAMQQDIQRRQIQAGLGQTYLGALAGLV